MKAKKQIASLRVFNFDKENYPYLKDKFNYITGEWAINVTQIFQEWFGREVKFAFLVDCCIEKEDGKRLAEKIMDDYNKNSIFWFDDGNVIIVLKNGKIFELTSSEWGNLRQLKGEDK